MSMIWYTPGRFQFTEQIYFGMLKLGRTLKYEKLLAEVITRDCNSLIIT